MAIYDLGLRLKQARELRNLSQAEAARRLSITRSSISSYESNASTPSLEVLRDLARLYNVQTDYLVGLTDRTLVYTETNNRHETDTILRVVSVIQEGFRHRESENNSKE